jgi:hypothetical protein
MLIPISSGLAVAVVSFTTSAVEDLEIDPSAATVTVTFANDGTYTGAGGISGFSGNWVTPTSYAGDDYEIRMTVNSGTTPAGSATGSWLGLGTTRAWSLTQITAGTKTANVTIEIRRASSGVVLSSGSGAFDMTAEVTI